MELSSHQEGEIPIPLNSAYVGGGGGGGGHGLMIHHHHHHDHAHHNNIISVAAAAAGAASPPINNGGPNISISTNLEEEEQQQEQEDHRQLQQQQQNGSSAAAIINKKITVAAAAHDQHDHHVTIKYKECLKNHAAAMGGNATDGCGEFMPSGEEGTIEALTCSACNCHRNFHRKEFEGGSSSQQMITNPFDHFYHPHPHPHHNFNGSRVGRKVILGHHHHHKNILAATPEALGYPTPAGTLISSRTGGAIMSYNLPGGGSESDEHEMGAIIRPATAAQQLVMNNNNNNNKKRFRTKFTPEQKEKMLNFAEKAGWKIQKQEESVVQQLCQEIGVKRRVLKVWMHNNKHNLAKRQEQQQHNHLLNINPPSSTTA